jgi:hypothetical protein
MDREDIYNAEMKPYAESLKKEGWGMGLDDVVAGADVVADTVSGFFGPAISGAMSLVDQAVSDDSLEELKKRKDQYGDWLNYEPRTEKGAAAGEYILGKVGEGIGAGIDFYKENRTENMALVQDIIVQAAKNGYDTLSDEAKFTLENVLDASELIPLMKAKKIASIGTPNTDVDAITPEALSSILNSAESNMQLATAGAKAVDAPSPAATVQKVVDEPPVRSATPTPEVLDAEVDERLQQVIKQDPTIRNLSDYEGGIHDGFIAPDKSLSHLMRNKEAEFQVLKFMAQKNDDLKDIPIIVLETALTKFKRPAVTADNIDDAYRYYKLIKDRAVVGRYNASRKDYSDKTGSLRGYEETLEGRTLYPIHKFSDAQGNIDLDNPRLKASKEPSDFDEWSPDNPNHTDRVGLVEDVLEEFGGYYRSMDLNDPSAAAEMAALLKSEAKAYKRIQKKYANRPDVEILKGEKDWSVNQKNKAADKTREGGDKKLLNTQDWHESKVDDEGVFYGIPHQELGIGASSFTDSPNFLGYQEAFGGRNPANVYYDTMNAADYHYSSSNMPAKVYDNTGLDNYTTSGLTEGAKARYFDLGVTGGEGYRATRLPHSMHLEFESAITEANKMNLKNVSDNPEMLKQYADTVDDQFRFSGKDAAELYGVKGSDKEILSSILKPHETIRRNRSNEMFNPDEDRGYAGLEPLTVKGGDNTRMIRMINLKTHFDVDWEVDDTQTRMRKITQAINDVGKNHGLQTARVDVPNPTSSKPLPPQMANAAYKEWKLALQEVAGTIKNNKGRGSRGSYIGMLDQLTGGSVPRSDANVSIALEYLAESLPPAKADLINKLSAKLKDLRLAKPGRHASNKTAVSYKEKRLPAANAIKELTPQFNVGGVVPKEKSIWDIV